MPSQLLQNLDVETYLCWYGKTLFSQFRFLKALVEQEAGKVGEALLMLWATVVFSCERKSGKNGLDSALQQGHLDLLSLILPTAFYSFDE